MGEGKDRYEAEKAERKAAQVRKEKEDAVTVLLTDWLFDFLNGKATLHATPDLNGGFRIQVSGS